MKIRAMNDLMHAIKYINRDFENTFRGFRDIKSKVQNGTQF